MGQKERDEVMPEYTDLYCNSPETAKAVLRYLNEQINEQEDPPFITAYVHKSTLRITYRDEDRRREWDMQLIGFRDGRESVAQAVASERERCAKALCEFCRDTEHNEPAALREGSLRLWHKHLPFGYEPCAAVAIRDDAVDEHKKLEDKNALR